MSPERTSFWQRMKKLLFTEISFSTFVLIAFISTVLAGFIASRFSLEVGVIATIFSATSFLSVILSAIGKEKDQRAKDELKEIEEKLKGSSDTDKTILTWELGRKVLESYLDRNIRHVRWIFIWTVLVIIIGFLIIIYGIINAYNGSININTNLLTVSTGLLIQFIGASFLLVYRSTSKQAKDYVTVLERINAVGMSVQILDSISNEREILKDETKAELSKKLLDMYTITSNGG